MQIEFSIPFTVGAKQGDRSRVVMPRTGKPFVAHHPDPKTKRNAQALEALCLPYVPAKPLEGPLQLEMFVNYPWRKSESKKRRASAWQPKDTKPDADNIAKQVCDVLEGMGFFANDAQISDLRVSKGWAARAELEVTITELTQEAGQ